MVQCKEPADRKIVDDKGKVIKIIRTFMIELEIDYQLITQLVKMKGAIKLVNTTLPLIGAGLEALIKADEEKEKQDRIDQDGQV